MTQLQAPAAAPEKRPDRSVRRLTPVAATGLVGAGLVAMMVVHLTQGTSSVDALDLWRLATGREDAESWNVLVGSRVPRLVAGVLVGVGFGVAGAIFSSLARNPLASPDTLGVNAGAYFAVVVSAALGLSLPTFGSGGLAFVGGLLAAGLVMALSAGGDSGPTRLILAGSATALALTALSTLFLLLYEQETLGLYAWSGGSLVQADLRAAGQLGPVIGLAMVAALLMAHRLDVLALGDDTASVLGMRVRRTRLVVTLLAVLLSAAAVTLVGPIGFVGLCAPVIARLIAKAFPRIHSHRVLIPLSAAVGIVIVLGADIVVRSTLGSEAGVMIPTGVVTTVFGAGVLIALARSQRDSGPTRQAPSARPGATRSRTVFVGVTCACTIVLAGVLVLAVLAGDTWLLLGDVANWVTGQSGLLVDLALGERVPRVVAAVLAGVALALAGTTVQAVCRNPLAEPGILGITSGAGLGAITLLSFVPVAGIWALSSAAGVGALVAFATVYGLSWRGGLDSDRLVLIGIAFSAGCSALVTFIIVWTDPWDTTAALTWLAGSTYGRTLTQSIPVAVALVLLVPVIVLARRELDLMTLDDDTPLVLGVPLERSRLVALGGAALLTSTAVSAVGVVGFVGLVAPHAARALVGGRHGRVIVVSALLGAILVSLADTLGRTVIAPAQIPAGLVTAIIGTPYFVWLLWRSRA